ncbi:MAG: hypothetical protein ACE5O2_00095 [Armatimonadota bacterium]
MPKHTPLYEAHKALRARMTLAGDWEIPLCFSTVREEHDAVRQSAGLFDLSHMGKIELAARCLWSPAWPSATSLACPSARADTL